MIIKQSILFFLIGNIVANNIYASEKKLDVYSAQIVGKYISNQDRLKLAQTNKKFQFLLDRERINREPIKSNDDAMFIPYMETQELFSAYDHIATYEDGTPIADNLNIGFDVSIEQLYSMLSNQYIESESCITMDNYIVEQANNPLLRGLIISTNKALSFDPDNKSYNLHDIAYIKRKYLIQTSESLWNDKIYS